MRDRPKCIRCGYPAAPDSGFCPAHRNEFANDVVADLLERGLLPVHSYVPPPGFLGTYSNKERLKDLIVEGRQPGFHVSSPLQREGVEVPSGSLVFYDADAADRFYRWLHREE